MNPDRLHIVLTRTLNWILLAAVVATAVVVARDFAHYADRYPYLAVDDALANVSYALGTEGRYGFFASPNQGFTGISRHQGFFSYGPWYFFLGGGLIWLFGYSLTMLRAIHLAGILAIAASGVWWFGRERVLVAGAMLALALLYSFDTSQWPMVRPDIAVAVFAVLFIVAAGRAIATGSATWWFLAGLGAGCAAWTHLIAWALVPAAVLTLGVGLAADWRGRRSAVWPAIALASSFAAATLMFYGSFGFRIADHLASVRAYGQFLGGRSGIDPRTYFTVLGTHVTVAFGDLRPLARTLLASSIVAACVLLAVSWFGQAALRRRAVGLLLPPLAVVTGYLLSLGTYPNYHTGYALLSQVSAWWTSAAAFAVLLAWLVDRWPNAGTWLRHALTIAVAALAVQQLSARGEEHERSKLAQGWVGIRDYTSQIQQVIPEGSTAWGSIPFGIENPGRIQLVQLVDGLIILERARLLAPVPVTAMAPDYLVWGYPENRDNTLQTLRSITTGYPVIFRSFEREFAEAPFRLLSMVTAPPYGTTRVFAREGMPSGTSSELPMVAAYDPANATWDRRVDGPIASSFAAVEPPVSFAVGYNLGPRAQGAVPPASADRSMRGDLPPGRYLIRVRVSSSTGATRRLLAVSTEPSVNEVITELGSRHDFAPFAGHDHDVFLLHEHPGGPVFISQFDNGRGSGISGIDVYRIRPAANDGPRGAKLEMPPLREWVPASAGVQASVAAPGALVVQGDNSPQGYQIRSPAVAASPGEHVTLRVALTVEQGAVCLGALDGVEKKWLVSGVAPAQELAFDVDETAGFVLMIYNCQPPQANLAPSRFTVSSARYGREDPGLYIDRLMTLLAKRPQLRTAPANLLVTPGDLERVTPIGVGDVEYHAAIAAPGLLGWTIKGRSEGGDTRVLRVKPADADAGAWLIVQGRLATGGLRIGVLENEQWARSVNVTDAGEFIAVIEVPRPGRYSVVVADNLSDPAQSNDVTLTSLGWRRPAPALRGK